MNKLTKIIATIGPSSDTPERIKKLVEGGVDIFRFNLKHNNLLWHKERIQHVRDVSKQIETPIGVLLDLQGPEIRITISPNTMEIKKGDEVILGDSLGEKRITVSHPTIIEFLKPNDRIVVDDGKFEFIVKEKKEMKAILRSESDGTLTSNKSLNVPGVYFPLPTLTGKDRDALVLAKKAHADFIALSFVRNAQDIKNLSHEMKKLKVSAAIVSKIETKGAIEHLDEIIEVSDSLMVARGDLGVELPLEQVPYYQKIMIKKCLEKGIPVITATQMLESMIEKPFATRAEISDIANAVYDFTDAVMLSGETASGRYPIQSVETMRKTVHFIEKRSLSDIRTLYNFHIADEEEMICDAAYNLYLKLLGKDKPVKGFIVFTHTGRTAKKLSRYRLKIPIFAFTPSKDVAHILTMSFGVTSFLHQNTQKNEIVKTEIQKTIDELTKESLVKKGDTLIILHGDYWTIPGGTSTIRIVKI